MEEFLVLLGRFIKLAICVFFALIKFGFVLFFFGLGILFIAIDILSALTPGGGPPSASAAMFKEAVELLEDISRMLEECNS